MSKMEKSSILHWYSFSNRISPFAGIHRSNTFNPYLISGSGCGFGGLATISWRILISGEAVVIS